MFALIVCERMHWSYAQYLEQPDWFIDKLLIKWGVDGEMQKL